MHPIDYVSRSESRLGGGDIIISLTPAQSDALGSEAGSLADWLHSAMWAMGLLRSQRTSEGEFDEGGAEDWFTIISDLDHRLLPRLEGVRDAAVRAHAEAGGSLAHLGAAMDVPRSTAQYRREVLTRSLPSTWETWAREGGPENKG